MTNYQMILIFFTLMISCKENKQDITPRIGKTAETLNAHVTLRPDILYAPEEGVVDSVFVEEGDFVYLYDRLMRVKKANSETTQNAKFTLDLARQNQSEKVHLLQQLEQDIQVARLNLQYDSIYYVRQKNLLKRNIGTQMEYDAKKNSYEVARKKLLLLMKRYRSIKIDIERQPNKVENQSKDWHIIHNVIVTSTHMGQIHQILKKPGEKIVQHEPILVISRADQMIVELFFDQMGDAKIGIGQQVLISLDAYKEEGYPAILTKIYPIKDVKEKTLKAEAKLVEWPKKLYPGLSGTAKIVIGPNHLVNMSIANNRIYDQ